MPLEDPVPSTSALPVAVCLPEPLAREVRAWMEAELGWQSVPPEGPPRPVLTLRESSAACAGAVVVVDGVVGVDTVREALRAGAADVISWPEDRGRIPGLARQVAAVPVTEGPPVIVVAGTRGGVGTSTVALAVGALAAWSGRTVVTVGEDGLLSLCGVGPWSGPGLEDVLALGPTEGRHEVPALACAVPGVGGLSVLGGDGAGTAVDMIGAFPWPADLVVVDAGVDIAHATLIVSAPDVRAARASERDVPLLVRGKGPLGPGQLKAVVGRRPVGWLPDSARIARAALGGRVPADLPGSWLRELRGALAGLVRP